MSLIDRLLSFVGSRSRDPDDRCRPSDDAVTKIRRWKTQLAEYERLGCLELARSLRESIEAHQRSLSVSIRTSA